MTRHARYFVGKTPEQRRIEELERELARVTQQRNTWQAEYDRLAQRHCCPFAGCYCVFPTRATLASHLSREHGANKIPARKLRELDREETG